MRLPSWNVHEYDCLKPDLSGPLQVWRHQQAQKRVADCEALVRELESEPLAGERLKVQIEEALRKKVATKPVGKNRQEFVEVQARRFRDAHHKAQRYPMERDQVDAIAEHILRCYMSVEIEAFQEDFGIIMAGLPDDESEDRIKKARESLEARKKSLKWDLKKEYRKLVRSVPKRWRNNTVSSQFPQYRMVEYICQEFVRDWQARAPLFDEPVTINGVAIRSLKSDLRKVWQGAYNELGLGDLKKRVGFVAVQFHSVEDGDDESVPEFFKKPTAKA